MTDGSDEMLYVEVEVSMTLGYSTAALNSDAPMAARSEAAAMTKAALGDLPTVGGIAVGTRSVERGDSDDGR